MKKLTASTYVASGLLWVYLDSKVIMQNSDSIVLDLADEEDYIVYWFVQGHPGSSYSITISSPKEAQFQLTRVIGMTGKGHGSFQFRG